ncbi:MAG: SGNH/GDSL hydrolase family protein [Alphaproteobacteria bacterium]|nr:SGNH/GDSL hydrolase family protein [Alphaproteobacteria bacterium]
MSASPPIPTWRKALYAAAVTVGVMLALSLLAELLARMGVVETERPGDIVVYVEDDYLTLKETADGPVFELQDLGRDGVLQARFSAEPAPGVARVMVVGGSFVRGEHAVPPGAPIKNYGSIPAWLDAELEWRMPGREVEVINAGASAQGTRRLIKVVPLLLRAKPDLVILIAGNNEAWIPGHGYDEVLHDWVLYRAMDRALRPPPEQAPRYAPQQASNPALNDDFGTNLRRIDRACRDAGVELLLGTVPINLADYDREPFTQQPDEAVERGRARCAEGDVEGALAAFADSTVPAIGLAAAGRCAQEHGRFELAREMLGMAVEVENKGRARPSLNQITREVAAEGGRGLVDVDAIMVQHAGSALPGEGLYIDNVHMKSLALRDVAVWIGDHIVEHGVIDPGDQPVRPSPTVDELVELRGWQELHRSVLSRRY